jgi:hypothetical protein
VELNFENYSALKQQKLSRADIADIFNIPEWKLKRHISANNWASKAPILLNIKAFDEYTEESCYWAGFLAADGNVDSKGRIRLMLKYDDLLHLEKFKSYLKSTHTISSNTTKYNRCSFEFTNKDMCEVLDINFNIVPNKTETIEFPKCIPENMLRHFIRGYFDGDGSICESFSNINSITATLYTTFCSGSYTFIKYLYDILAQTINVGGHLQNFNTGKKWQIKYNTLDSIKLLNFIYKDSKVYLDRKYNLFHKTVVENNRLKR